MRGCPFCGAIQQDTFVVFGSGRRDHENVTVAQVVCVCGAKGPLTYKEEATNEGAIKAWNRRMQS